MSPSARAGKIAARLDPAKPTLFGVRTPWALAGARVRDRTHRLAGRLRAPSGLMLLAASARLQRLAWIGDNRGDAPYICRACARHAFDPPASSTSSTA